MKKTRLIQLIGNDGYEALFEVPVDTTEEEIQSFYKTYEKHEKDNLLEVSSFEEYMDEFFPEADFTRKFVDEIYI